MIGLFNKMICSLKAVVETKPIDGQETKPTEGEPTSTVETEKLVEKVDDFTGEKTIT